MGCSCTKSLSGERNKLIDNIMFFFRNERRRMDGPKTTAFGPGFIQVECPEEEQDLETFSTYVHSERNKVLAKLPTIEEETSEELFLEKYAEHLKKQLLRNENTMTWRNKLETILEETDEELLAEKYGKRTVQQRTLYRSKFTSLGLC